MGRCAPQRALGGRSVVHAHQGQARLARFLQGQLQRALHGQHAELLPAVQAGRGGALLHDPGSSGRRVPGRRARDHLDRVLAVAAQLGIHQHLRMLAVLWAGSWCVAEAGAQPRSLTSAIVAASASEKPWLLTAPVMACCSSLTATRMVGLSAASGASAGSAVLPAVACAAALRAAREHGGARWRRALHPGWDGAGRCSG